MTTVLCFGTFDILHLGHLHYFKFAKQYADNLIVIIARDFTREKLERSATFDEHERLEMVQSLEIVDDAKLGYEGNHFKIIEELKPDVICLGYDHEITEKVLQEKLASMHLFPKIVRSTAYKTHQHKSSKIKESLLRLS